MYRLKKFINWTRDNWGKLLLTSIALVVATAIVSAVLKNDAISIVLFFVAAFAALFAVIGFVTLVLEKLGGLGKKVAKSVKNLSKSFGGQKSKKKKSSKGDDIVTLTSANGEEIDFIEIAGIAHGGNFYAILQPVELLAGMDDNDALVFKVTRDKYGEDHFNLELDDAINDAVFREYNRLLDQQRR